MNDRVEIYLEKVNPDGDTLSAEPWRWRRIAPNGEIIAQGEGYSRQHDALIGAMRACRDLPREAFTFKEDDAQQLPPALG